MVFWTAGQVLLYVEATGSNDLKSITVYVLVEILVSVKTFGLVMA